MEPEDSVDTEEERSADARGKRMNKKICPVCDTEIKSGKYCRVCRRIVWHPRYEVRGFSLNEENCSKAVIPEYKPELSAPFYGEQEKRRERVYQPAGGRECKGIPLSIFIFTVIAACVMTTWILVGVSSNTSVHNEWLEEEAWEDEYISEYQEYAISEEEAKAAGVNCDWYSHSELTKQEAKKVVDDFLSGCEGIEIEEGLYSDNYKYVYESGMEETSFSSGFNYYLNIHASEPEIIGVDYDTATGQVHYFYISSSNIGLVTDFTLKMAEVMDDSDSVKNPMSDELGQGLSHLPYADQEDYNDELWVYGDNWYVYGYLYDGSYSVWIEADERTEDDTHSAYASER